jgi:hypothetical protein
MHWLACGDHSEWCLLESFSYSVEMSTKQKKHESLEYECEEVTYQQSIVHQLPSQKKTMVVQVSHF